MRRIARKWVGLVAVLSLAVGIGQALAQASVPDGAFVRDTAGNVWLVAGGQRVSVPFYQATDAEVAAIPDSGQWLVPAGDGSGTLTLGARPSWAGGTQAAGATPIPGDALPTVTIQVDDEVVNPGQTVSVTLIGSDDNGLEWIEWEGTYYDEGEDNDNRSTGDPTLDGRHRHECDGEEQCANVWTVTPTKSGRFVLRARARDEAEQTSEWVEIPFRVR